MPRHLTSIDQVPDGLDKPDWQSISAAYEAGRHAFQPVDGGWQAHNPGQQWTTRFDGRGFLSSPKVGDWKWGLELMAYGFSGAERAVGGVPTVEASGARLTYRWDQTVTEWYVNDQRGLEHGFTVAERPVGAANTPLLFSLAVRGTLLPHITTDSLGVNFHDSAGTTVLTYAGLKVWDADGKILPSRFAPIDPLRPSLVILAVDEYDARYPLTIDPIAQQAYLKPAAVGTTQENDQVGWSVAVSGNTVVVGAYLEDSSNTGVNSTPNELATDAGAAYVFVRSGTTWTQQAYLKPSATGTSQAFDAFGRSVAIDGDTIIVGAMHESSNTTGVNSTPNELSSNSGAAYIFVRNGTTWTQQAYLKASQVTASDEFGVSVAVSGDTVVVGARFDDSDTIGVNSAPNELAANAGAAYVFVRSGTTWTQQAYLKASQVTAGDLFGCAVDVSGSTVVVAARGEDSGTTGVNSTPNELANNAGAAYVFIRSGITWTQQAYLKPSAVGTTQALDLFGVSAAISGDTVVVGAYLEDSDSTGVNSTPNESSNESGAAYVFVRSGTTWTQQAYLKPAAVGTTQAFDHFGGWVAVAADTVVVGANVEDGSATGVNNAPNESAGDSGAAYVFVRIGTTWTQQAYLKPTAVGTTQVGDFFGSSVAVSGDTVIVGALLEDSSTTGVNSASNEAAIDSGATYIFTGLGPPPTVASISPAIGSISGGTSVSINGTGFSATSAVAIGGSPVTSFTVNSNTSITAITPSHAAGTVNVEVTTSTGTATGSNLFTYAVPDITVSQSGLLTDASGSVGFGFVTTGGGGAALTFTINNPSSVMLANLAVSKDGTDASAFTVGALSSTSVPAGGSASFTVTFNPASAGSKSAAIHIASDVPGTENPFDIALTGSGNTAPTFTGYAVATVYQTAASVSFAKLLTQAADANGDALAVSAAGPASVQGGTAVLQSGSILYTPPTTFTGADSFPVTIADVHGATVSGTVSVTVGPAPGTGGQNGNTPQLSILPGGDIAISFTGIPGRSYLIQRSTNLTTWATIATVVAANNGAITFTDENPPVPSAYYRLRRP